MLMRLQVYLASPDATAPHSEMAEYILPPSTLIKMDRTPWFHLLGPQSLVELGARAFLRMGKDDAAAETARGGLAEAKKVQGSGVYAFC